MIKKYLRDKLAGIVLFAAFALVIFLVCWVYGVPAEGAVYALCLCLALGIAALAVGYVRFKGRYGELKRASELERAAPEALPEPAAAEGELYTEIIRKESERQTRVEEELERRRREQEDYFTLWSHQIKTPIAAMSVLLQAMQEDSARALQGELFKIEQYTDMAMQYARLENIAGDLDFARCSVESLVRRCVKKYAPLFIGGRVRVELHDLDNWVLTDEKWLSFVVEQVLSNAIKYSPGGTVSIYMTDGVTLAVEDTGIGIAPENLPRVFERGFTGFNGRENMRSTGIGLYLCKKVMKSMSHDIFVESEPGKGTKVTLKLLSGD